MSKYVPLDVCVPAATKPICVFGYVVCSGDYAGRSVYNYLCACVCVFFVYVCALG